MNTSDAIHRRRSVGKLSEPAPSRSELEQWLSAAACAPDHQELRPWRFVILAGPAKLRFGEVLAGALAARAPGATAGQLDKERTKLDRAPVVVVVAARRLATDLPFEELLASTAAATQNLLLAATDAGYGSMWRTGDMAYDTQVKLALGLDEHDAIVAFVYVGTPTITPPPPPHEPHLTGIVQYWQPAP